MEKPSRGQFLEVTADRVLGHAQPGHQLRDDDAAVTVEASEDFVSALRSEHRCGL
jgi:hypothetical protein